MDLKDVKQLAELMEKYGLSSAEISDGDRFISLTKGNLQTSPAPVQVQAQQIEQEKIEDDKKPDVKGEALTAPLVGVAYVAPKPGAEPYVQVGSRVTKGQTLCILEAMKVMNEFTAPRDGEIAQVCIEDGKVVEYGQCLFRLL